MTLLAMGAIQRAEHLIIPSCEASLFTRNMKERKQDFSIGV